MAPSMLVTLKITAADSKLIAYALRLATNREVEFRPFNINEKIDLDFKSIQLWTVLESISEYGKLRVGGIDFEDLQMMRRPLMRGERVSMCIYEASVKRVVSYLSFLSGLPLEVVSGDAEVRISASFSKVTFNEIIASISVKAGIKIEVRETAPAGSMSKLGNSSKFSSVLEASKWFNSALSANNWFNKILESRRFPHDFVFTLATL
jgi:hypothetical protein